jgi:hypothetical protein
MLILIVSGIGGKSRARVWTCADPYSLINENHKHYSTRQPAGYKIMTKEVCSCTQG